MVGREISGYFLNGMREEEGEVSFEVGRERWRREKEESAFRRGVEREKGREKLGKTETR